MLRSVPIDFFAEIAPGAVWLRGAGFSFDAALGVRFYL